MNYPVSTRTGNSSAQLGSPVRASARHRQMQICYKNC